MYISVYTYIYIYIYIYICSPFRDAPMIKHKYTLLRAPLVLSLMYSSSSLLYLYIMQFRLRASALVFVIFLFLLSLSLSFSFPFEFTRIEREEVHASLRVVPEATPSSNCPGIKNGRQFDSDYEM